MGCRVSKAKMEELDEAVAVSVHGGSVHGDAKKQSELMDRIAKKKMEMEAKEFNEKENADDVSIPGSDH